jgi:hypothetical protein
VQTALIPDAEVPTAPTPDADGALLGRSPPAPRAWNPPVASLSTPPRPTAAAAAAAEEEEEGGGPLSWRLPGESPGLPLRLPHASSPPERGPDTRAAAPPPPRAALAPPPRAPASGLPPTPSEDLPSLPKLRASFSGPPPSLPSPTHRPGSAGWAETAGVDGAGQLWLPEVADLFLFGDRAA